MTATPSSTQIDLAWKKVTGATSYTVYRDDGDGGLDSASLGDVTSFSDKNLKPGGSYVYKVKACQVPFLYCSEFSNEVSSRLATCLPATISDPPSPSFWPIPSVTDTTFSLTGKITIAKGDVCKNGVIYVWANYNELTFFKTGDTWTLWEGGTPPHYYSGTLSNSGAFSPGSVPIIQKLDAAKLLQLSGAHVYLGYGLDVSDLLFHNKYNGMCAIGTAPCVLLGAQTMSVPTGLTATTVGSSQINLTWTALTGTGATYKVFRGGTQIANTGIVANYSDTGLTASTSYSYTVAACDAAGNNCSAQSTAASATTPSATASSNASCKVAAGEAFGSDDLDWNDAAFKAVQLWPVPAVTGSGDRGRAIRISVSDKPQCDYPVFNADGTSKLEKDPNGRLNADGSPVMVGVMEKRVCYPRGIVLNFTNESAYGANDYVVSQCAHDFDTPAGPNCQKLGAATGGQIAQIRFGNTPPLVDTPSTRYMAKFDCTLSRNTDYYINFRSSSSSRSTGSSQFNFFERVD